MTTTIDDRLDACETLLDRLVDLAGEIDAMGREFKATLRLAVDHLERLDRRRGKRREPRSDAPIWRALASADAHDGKYSRTA
jgi:hypothetical protein